MTKNIIKLGQLLFTIILSLSLNAQVVFIETMDGHLETSISTWETNDYYDNDELTMSGTGEMSDSDKSDGYFAAYGDNSGNCNVYLNSSGEYFQIEGINTTGFSDLELSFGIKKSTGGDNGTNLQVSYSTDGSSWTNVSTGGIYPTGPSSTTSWHYVSLSGFIPETSSLYIRFTSLDASEEFHIDDIRITKPALIVESYDLSAYGDTILLGENPILYLFSIEAISTEVTINAIEILNTFDANDFETFIYLWDIDYASMTYTSPFRGYHPSLGTYLYDFNADDPFLEPFTLSDNKQYFCLVHEVNTYATDENTFQTSAIPCSNLTYTVDDGLTPHEVSNATDGLVYTIKRPNLICPITSISGLNYSVTNGPSTEQTFTIKGDYLVSNLTITAPTNYEISETSGSGFTNSIVLSPTENKVATRTIYVRLKAGLSEGTYNNEDITITCDYNDGETVTCNGTVYKPIINISETTLNGFEYNYNSGPSTSQQFTVNGNYLIDDIVINAPTNYEISEDNSTFSGSISLTPVSNTVTTTTIYVRLKSGLIPSEYNLEDIVLSSSEADSKYVECNGQVIIPEVTNLTVGCKTNTSAEISWTEPVGSYDGVIIAIRHHNTFYPHEITDGTDPSTLIANAEFGSGTEFGIAEPPSSYVVYKGSGNSLTISGLTSGETYNIKAYTYTGNYWSDDIDCPLASIHNVYVPQINSATRYDSNAESDLYWTNPTDCYDDILVVCKHNSAVSSSPTGDGSSYNANSTFGSGTDIGSGEFVVYSGTGNSSTITGLTNGETYYAKIFTRSNDEWSEGVELILYPDNGTIFTKGDLAIIGVNSYYKEFTFISFVDIIQGTTIDFTDNGWQEENPDSWGTIEGVIRLKRISGGTLPAGTSITILKNAGMGSSESDFDVYVNGVDQLGANWSIEMLNTSQGLGFNINPFDEIWLMQGGAWLENDLTTDPDNDDDVYTGNVFYGFTATGWGTGISYNKSDLYPGCDCFNTDVTGKAYNSRIKYTGSLTSATKLEWITRFNNEANWQGYSSDFNYDNASPQHRTTGLTISIDNGDFESGIWTGTQNTDWFDCGNWQDLTVPDEGTDVVIKNSSPLNYAEIDNVGNAVCNNLTIDSGYDLYLYAGNNLEVNGDFLNNGDFSTIGAATIQFYGNCINNDNAAFFDSEVSFLSDEQQSIKCNGTAFDDIIFNNINSGDSDIILLDDLTVANSATFTNGIVNTGTNKFIFGFTASSNEGTGTSFVDGTVEKINFSTPFTFPTGDVVNRDLCLPSDPQTYKIWAPFTADPAAATTVNVKYSFSTPEVDYSHGAPLTHTSGREYWLVNSSQDLDISLYWKNNNPCEIHDFCNNGSQLEHLTVAYWDTNWKDAGGDATSESTITGSISSSTSIPFGAKSQGIITFGGKDPAIPLPIELIKFEATCIENTTQIKWTTANETNNDYFILEKSSDAYNWSQIALINGQGNSNNKTNYSFTDNKQFDGENYYRLKQVNYDKTYQISKIISINCFIDASDINIFPNPAKNVLYITSNQQHTRPIKYEVYDISGKIVLSDYLDFQTNTKNAIDISFLDSGIYCISLNTGTLKTLKRFVKQ